MCIFVFFNLNDFVENLYFCEVDVILIFVLDKEVKFFRSYCFKVIRLVKLEIERIEERCGIVF